MASAAAELFRQNLWANLRLLDACAGLSEDELAATAPGTHGAVRDTLTHLFASEARYVGEFIGKPPETRPEELPFAGFDSGECSCERRGSNRDCGAAPISSAFSASGASKRRGWTGIAFATKQLVADSCQGGERSVIRRRTATRYD